MKLLSILLTLGLLAMLLTETSCTKKMSAGEKEAMQIKEEQITSNTQGVEVMNKMTFFEHVELYWNFLFGKEETTPDVSLPQQKVATSNLLTKDDNQLKVSWLGHSSLLINIDGRHILTDPIFERKVSIVGPTRFNKKLPLDIDELPKVDAVIISHDHYDHLNKFSIKQLKDKTSVFIVPLGVGERLIDWGIPREKVVELNWWDKHQLDPELTIAATPSQHFSGRGLFDRNSTLWASWVIKSENHRLFFSGDSGYFDGFKEIGDKYGPFDVTFLECGAYNEGWSKIHMFPEQTVKAHIDLKGKILQPIHWGTFNLSLHAWYDPMERVIKESRRKNVITSTPMVGSVTDYDSFSGTDLWWRLAMEDAEEQLNQDLVTSHQ